MKRDYQDIIGGGLLVGLGVFCAIYAYNEYDMGTMSRMGPGFFPTWLGILLAIIGVLIILPALARAGTEGMKIEWRTAFLVLASIIAFAVTLRTLGLVVATMVTVIVGSMADRDTTWRLRLIMAVIITIFTVLIFQVGLGMVLPLWWWDR